MVVLLSRTEGTLSSMTLGSGLERALNFTVYHTVQLKTSVNPAIRYSVPLRIQELGVTVFKYI
jgi:hypothetical protein